MSKTSQTSSSACSYPSIIKTIIFTIINMMGIWIFASICLIVWYVGLTLLHSSAYSLENASTVLKFTEKSLTNQLFSWELISNHLIGTPWATALQQWLDKFALGVLVMLIIKTMWLRLWVFVSWLPFASLLILASLLDGLTQRRIRRYKGARESTFIFHRAKLATSLCFYLPLWLFWSCPLCIDPEYFLLPSIILLCLSTFLCAKYFKKYL